jgi:hypothetical protein
MEMEIPEDDPENEEMDDNSSDGNDDDEDPREVFDAWLKDQDEKVQAMYEENIAGLKSALDKERKAAKEAARLQAELDKYKTDEEKALEASQAQVVELTEKLAQADVKADAAVEALEKAYVEFDVTTAAIKAGFEDPEDALALLPEGAIKFNKKTGKVEGTEDALKELMKEKPYLVLGEGVGTPKTSGRKRLPGKEPEGPKPNIRF